MAKYEITKSIDVDELNKRSGLPTGKKRTLAFGAIIADRVEVRDMANFVRTLGAGVLAGHNVPTQVEGDGVRAVHAAFLAQGLDGPAALDRGGKPLKKHLNLFKPNHFWQHVLYCNRIH